MQLQRYLLMAWRWWWLIVSVTVLTAGAAYIQSRRTVPVYSASATLMINQAPSSVASSATSDSILTSQRLASTYVELLRKRMVLTQVVRDLSLPVTPAELAGRINVESVRDTQLIVVSVEDTDPAQAAAIANKTAQVFQNFITEQQLERYTSLKDSLTSQMKQTESDIAAAQSELDALGTQRTAAEDLRAGQLQTTLGQYRSSYASLLTSLAQVRLAEAQATSNVVMAEEAIPSVTPVRPRTARDTALAAVLGVVLALGVIFLIEYLDDTIKTPDDVDQAVKLPTLGLIARIEGEAPSQKLVAALSPRSPISEAYRTLRTNLEFGGVDAPLKSFLVTSSNPTEGKSTTVANLAIVLAQAGKRVIAVDSDLRRPMLHKYFKLSNSLGLTTALLNSQTRAEAYLQPTEIENLSVMCSGPLPPNPAELLGSRRMKQIIDELEEQADVVVCDSPPLLVVTDAVLLARQTDGVLLVIDAGNTRRAFLARGRDILKSANARLLGVVLNRITLSRSGYYSYAYQYYYYYSSDGERRRRHAGRGTLARLFGRNGHSPSTTAAQPVKQQPAADLVVTSPQVQERSGQPAPQDRTKDSMP
jgi:capsular exopolysaccharide synthesis family protein